MVNGDRMLVINPADRVQVKRLADAFCRARWSHVSDNNECDPLTFSSMKEALRSLITPPKPDEPQGFGAIVEDEGGQKWLRDDLDSSMPWWRKGYRRKWSDIAAVKVLSEGVAQ